MLIAALTAFGQEHAGKGAAKDSKQPHCPVMGDEPANLAIKVETNEGPVFFCCKECVGKYQADPGKYAAKVAAQRKALADRPKVQVTCPTCKEAADAKISMEIEGKKIFFSSTECLNKYKSEPGKYAAALANSYTYQTKCPVMGEEIDPKAFTTLANGMRVYYCCKGCDKKLLADPAKYAGKLAAQGIVLEPKDLVAAPAKDQSGQGG